MFQRESKRERTLLKIIDRQQATIDSLVNKLMFATGNTWELPPHPENITPAPERELREYTFHPEQDAA